MNYCLNFSTCLYYDLTNCKTGLLKPRSTRKKVTLTVDYIKHKLNKYLILLSECQNLHEGQEYLLQPYTL